MMKSTSVKADLKSEVAVMRLLGLSRKACMRGSFIGLTRRLIWCTRSATISRSVTSWCCDSKRALERPTYPAPATVIFIRVLYSILGRYVSQFSKLVYKIDS